MLWGLWNFSVVHLWCLIHFQLKKCHLFLRQSACHQPARRALPVVRPGQWPGRGRDRNLGSLCPETSPESPSQIWGRWRRSRPLNPPESRPLCGWGLERAGWEITPTRRLHEPIMCGNVSQSAAGGYVFSWASQHFECFQCSLSSLLDLLPVHHITAYLHQGRWPAVG